MLNPQSPVPLYYQLAEILLNRIRSGDFPPGTRIPSEQRLAATYQIGRPTVRQATEQLVRKGVLIRRRGAGTFVRKEKEVDLFSFGGTISSFRRGGISVTTSLLEKAALKAVKKDGENPFAGQKAYFLSRLSRAEGEPVLIEHIYLDAALFQGIDRFDLIGQSLSRIADERYYLRPVGGKQNFRIGLPNEKMAKDLSVTPSTPILVVKRYIHFEPAENGVYAELYCRTDRYVFSQQMEV